MSNPHRTQLGQWLTRLGASQASRQLEQGMALLRPAGHAEPIALIHPEEPGQRFLLFAPLCGLPAGLGAATLEKLLAINLEPDCAEAALALDPQSRTLFLRGPFSLHGISEATFHNLLSQFALKAQSIRERVTQLLRQDGHSPAASPSSPETLSWLVNRRA
ncbi:CesT family type III secretion system chaperone [Chitinimonas lacunae]|uniref:CesT family type III secretion system chaperone n=1 Tax=Chitinimonas lacunae TaxID=1963018 RepID=A0ABV8MR07_9NEIS